MTRDALSAAQEADRRSTAGLRRIIGHLGVWPGRSLVGEEACQAATTIVLHSDHDPAFQRLMLRALRAAFEKGEATGAQWAHLQDRCLVHDGKRQLFGTQFWYESRTGIQPYPIEAPEGLDARRAEVGLQPHTEQVQLQRERHGAPASSIPPAHPTRFSTHANTDRAAA
ncbi:hypothetical protein OG705_29695 [Streptomyces sp. NBC_00838]|uniref:DUF6624 domain-containing protein n=1 Tax=Streptomyces sp. NBC_00838 TaxID=2903680 RepID=UPI00386372B6|nr:hypothetical protein OG705_29695 [Streptomyces sp. NBC_00838]